MADRYQTPPEGYELPLISSPPKPEPAPADKRYAAPQPGYKIPYVQGYGEPPSATVPPVPAGPLSAQQVAKSAYEHIIPSAKKTAEEFVYPITHMPETWEGMKTLGAGLASKAAPYVGSEYQSPEGEQALGAIKDYYSQRYGNVEGAKRAFAEDPVGVLGDVATVMTGVGGAARLPLKFASKAGPITSTLGKAGTVVGEMGRAIDPVTVAAEIAGQAVKPVTKYLAPGWSSLQTGKTFTSIQDAERAGATQNPEFFKHLYGSGKVEDPINAVDQSIRNLRNERSQDYLNSSAGWKSNQVQLDMTDIKNEIAKQATSYSPSGVTPKYMAKPLRQINDAVKHWEKSNRTMSDLDFLKRDLDKLYRKKPFLGNDEARAALTAVRDKTWKTIVNHDPQYADIMSRYEDATKELQGILGEVGTNKASATTRLKKLIKASDAGTIDRLIQDNPNLPYMIAGQELRPLFPGGVREGIMGSFTSAIPFGIASQVLHPSALLGFAGMMPKVAGTGMAGLGFARQLPRMLERSPVTQSARRTAMELGKPFMESDETEEQAFGGRIGRATGGGVNRGMTAQMLIAAVERAKAEGQKSTESILDQPDEHVVHALKVANENI